MNQTIGKSFIPNNFKMVCNNSKLLVIEEMKILIQFIENENEILEKEKNELKVKYHGRPTEERNIMKDILTMHSEFEYELAKIKEIADDFCVIPPSKNEVTDKTEGRIQKIAKMQEGIIVFHENVQKLLFAKANFQMQNEPLKCEIWKLTDKNKEFSEKIENIRSYENHDLFIQKARELEKECDRLSEIVVLMENRGELNYNGISPENFQNLSIRKAEKELEKIKSENDALDKRVHMYGDILSNIDEEKELKKIIAKKKIEIEKLKGIYKKIQYEVDMLERFEEDNADDYEKKMKILDRIIGKKNEFSKILSPRGFQKKMNNLEDIEVSLKKAKALASPTRSK